MTKREMFNEIINFAEENEREDIVDFALKEIDLIDKRANKKNEAKKAKREENEALANDIVIFLGTKESRISASEIAKNFDVSVQKIAFILKSLVSDDKIVYEIEKGKRLYGVVI